MTGLHDDLQEDPVVFPSISLGLKMSFLAELHLKLSLFLGWRAFALGQPSSPGQQRHCSGITRSACQWLGRCAGPARKHFTWIDFLRLYVRHVEIASPATWWSLYFRLGWSIRELSTGSYRRILDSMFKTMLLFQYGNDIWTFWFHGK